MAKKHRRPSKKDKLRKRPSRSVGEWGHYIFRDHGVSVVYVAKADEDGSVEAALFGVDTWRDGLIICCGRRFDTKESFEAAMQERPDSIKRTSRELCRVEIAYGMRVRVRAKAEMPPDFDQWRHLVDPLEDVRLPASIYRCPKCGGSLPDIYVPQLLDGVDDGDAIMYFTCERCRRSRAIQKSALHVSSIHRQLVGAIEEIEEFSVTWYQDNMPALIHIPIDPVFSEAIETMISEGDDLTKTAAFSIESQIARAAVPNRIVQDKHVRDALQAAIDGELVVNDEDDEDDPVLFLVEAIEVGINMFNEAMGFRGQKEYHVNSALQWAIESVGNHHSNKDPRAYIRFISRFTPV